MAAVKSFCCSLINNSIKEVTLAAFWKDISEKMRSDINLFNIQYQHPKNPYFLFNIVPLLDYFEVYLWFVSG